MLNDFPNLAELTIQCHFCNLHQENSTLRDQTRQDYNGNIFLVKSCRVPDGWAVDIQSDKFQEIMLKEI